MSKVSCTCAKCVSACHYCPGMMSPEDARKALAAGAAKKLMLDWRGGNYPFDEENVFALSAATVGHGGRYAPYPDPDGGFLAAWNFRMGKCSLLVDNRCSIHDSGFKPIECREALGCGAGDVRIERDTIAEMWDTPEGRAIVKEWKILVGW